MIQTKCYGLHSMAHLRARLEPLSRGLALLGMRNATLALWGDAGLRAVAARLPEETRAATIDEIVLPITWLPTRYIIEWVDAVWRGPAQEIDGAFGAFVARGVELGFGRIRRFFLGLVSLERMAAHAPLVWRREHTHGTLSVVVSAAGDGATVTLRDHPYVKSERARRAEAEVYRTILTLAGRHDVREKHALDGDSLVVRLTFRA
jgi:hypothetical protein